MNSLFRHALRKSLGFKILAAFIAVIVVVLSVFTLFSVVREGNKAKAGLREQGGMLARLLSHGAVVGVFAENRKLLQEATEGVINLNNVVSISIYNAEGKASYSRVRSSLPQHSTAIPPLHTSGLATIRPVTILETPDAFEFIRPVVLHTPPERDEKLYFDTPSAATTEKTIGYVRIVLSKDAYDKEIRSVITQQAVIMLVFIFCSSAIVSFAVKRVTRPLEKLTDKVKALEQGLHVEPVPIETDDEVGNLATAFNAMVVARTKAEESLRESEERYRRLVELSPDAIYVQQQERIVFINAAGAGLLGASGPAQILGRRMTDFIHDDDCANLRKRFLQVEEEGVAIPLLPIRYRQCDGASVDAAVAVAPFMFKGDCAVLVIARDETERKGMEEKIALYQEELRSTARELSSIESRIEERERHLIAADLHDYVGQNLVVSHFKLGGLRKALTTPESIRHLEDVRELIAETTQYTRSLTIELSPPILVELGLTAAVEALAEEFERTHGIRISVHDDNQPGEIDDDTRYLLFRSVRELLMNVVKHARAGTVRVAFAAEDKVLRITIADDGRGFDPTGVTGKQGGFGLFSIRERLKRMHGSCEIESRPGAGTTVVLTALRKR